MPPLKTPITSTEPRDVSPASDLPGNLFALVEWGDWRSGIEPHLDGVDHSYLIVGHFDRPEVAHGEVTRFVKGADKRVIWRSDAATWDEWKKDYYTALRAAIDAERRRLTGMRLFLQGKLTRK